MLEIFDYVLAYALLAVAGVGIISIAAITVFRWNREREKKKIRNLEAKIVKLRDALIQQQAQQVAAMRRPAPPAAAEIHYRVPTLTDVAPHLLDGERTAA